MLNLSILIVILLAFSDNTTSEATSNIILTNNEHKMKNVGASECITQIAKEHISCNSVVFFVSSSNHVDTFLRSSNEYCFSMITRSFAGQRWLEYSDAYFISANNATDFLNGLLQISTDLSWNPRAKFVIIFRDKVHEITKIFQALINLMMFNVVLLTNTGNNEIEGFAFYLHNRDHCSRNASNIRSLGYCPKFREPLFLDKDLNDFGNCTLNVALKEEVPYVLYNNNEYVKYLKTGAEQYLLETIAEHVKINLKYHFLKPHEDFGNILPNRTSTGLLGYLQRRETDVIAGGLLLSGNRLEVFDYILGYSYSIFSVYTPTLDEERWSRVYKQFSVTTWFLIILSFLFTVLVILTTKALTSGKSKDEFLTMLKLWRYFYGQADVGLFKDRYIQWILIVWIIFTSCIYAFYNTASYSLITRHVQDKIKINHSDLAALPFKPCITEPTRDFFRSAYNEHFPNNDVEYGSQCESPDAVFKSVAMRNDLYTVETDYAFYLRAINYLNSEGQPKITKWDYPRTDILSIYFTKGFPLRKAFQKYALYIHETGLLQRHLSYIYSKKPKVLPTLKRKHNAIRLKDFKIHYSVLLIGSLISFICFLLEYKTCT